MRKFPVCFLVFCAVAMLLEALPSNAESRPPAVNPVAVVCESWHKSHSFDDLRSCFLSVVHRREHRANVEAMLGRGELVQLLHQVWAPPRVAYSYTPVDRTNFHYVALYENDVVVGYCSYSLNADGQPSVVLP